ncbi:MAG: FAD:protein FMN transferase [Saprospiraceae bacterium]|nr:FAD:protein FMN transferase [Saprospiraceae bacterium]
MKRTYIFFLWLPLCWAACQADPPRYMRLEGQAQGTTFHLVYRDAAGRDFSGSVDSLFRLIDHSMSLWDSSSIIRQLNRNEPSARADVHFAEVFRQAQAVSEVTGGAFDITVGPLVKAWGFSYKKGLPPPDSAQVDSLQQCIGFQKVRLDNGVLLKANPRMEVDLNAIAQGYTVDVMAQFLEQKGVTDYMVEIGGELRTAGRNEKNEPWQIGIDKPQSTESADRPLQAVVSLSGQSMATSGSYRKFVLREGKKFSHAIDPKTGYPITHQLLSVSVLARDCATADAYATAFLVMGLEKTFALAEKTGLEVYAIYADGEGALQVRTNFSVDLK